MGEIAINQDEVTNQEPTPQTTLSDVNVAQPSEPCEVIVNSNRTPSTSQEKIEKIHDGISSEYLPKAAPVLESTAVNCSNPSNEKVRTKTEARKPEGERKPLIDSLESVTSEPPKLEGGLPKDRFLSKSSPVTPNAEKKNRIGSAASGMIERADRNQSDIFSLKEETTIGSSIFSVNGSPSRKVFRRRELAVSNVFPFGQREEPPLEKVPALKEKVVRDTKESYNELKRPSSSVRNPLTGTGLSSNDEYKFKGNKRKDGNPLLGLGYSPEATPSAHRIPPGGYSHKLW